MTAHRIYTLSFLLSGAAGLVYQIIWVRMLSLVFGNTVYAVSMVISGFMAGLALGAYYWGKKADKVTNPLRTYIFLEIGIAISALGASWLIFALDDVIVNVMTVDSLTSGHWQLIRFALVFVILVVPTALMGGTLPMMSKFYVKNIEQVGRGIGSLYAANTYGAMAGCFISGYLLISYFGVQGTLITASIINVLVALAVWITSIFASSSSSRGVIPNVTLSKKEKREEKKRLRKEANKTIEEVTQAIKTPVGLALTLGALSGFCALAFEILWIRAFVVSFKSTVYLLSNFLAVYLLGMALGSHFFSKRLDRIKDPMRFFGLAQVAIGVWGMVSILIFFKTHNAAAALSSLAGEMTLSKDILILLLLMAIVVLLPTFLIGLAYPLICRVITQSMGRLGKSAGEVYAFNTLGAIIGSFSAGFILLPLFGLQNSLFIVSTIAILTGYSSLIAADTRKGVSWAFPASAFAALFIFAGVMISGNDIGLGARTKGKIVFAKEGVTGSVRVVQSRQKGPLTLMVNNYQLATSGDVAVRFGHIPLLLKPDAKDVLLISLGSGITAGSVGAHPVEHIDCVEIVPSLLDIQNLFKSDNHNIVADKRFNLIFWDGRHYVRMTKKKYDLVIADLFQPDSAGVGNLYALEHYLNVKRKLKPGGAMAQWLPLYQLSPDNLKVIMRTFASAFEHVLVWAGDTNSESPTLMLFGSPDPIGFDLKKLFNAMDRDGVKKDMIEHADAFSFLNFFVMDREGVGEFTRGYPINTDSRPVIEYSSPKNIWSRKENAIANFASLVDRRVKIVLSDPGEEKHSELTKMYTEYFEGRTNLLKGKVEHARRNYPGELEYYKKAAKLTPKDPFLGLAVFDLGFMYYNRGDFRTSSKMFEWVKRISENLLEAHFYLAKSYQNLGEKEKSVAAFNDLAKLNPDVAESLVSR
ncbi:Spermidine synthase [hydrothermal vent metagenome]|uniref:Spermidine synthase n=1 Tax=hydrothermal vent metagenome TaxID=652676 RepID=A0A3B1CL74_9ZZZZ